MEGQCIRIQGADVVPKTIYDGGSCDYSLKVNATSYIIKAEPFEVCLMFMHEIQLKHYFVQARKTPSCLTFFDNFEKSQVFQDFRHLL